MTVQPITTPYDRLGRLDKAAVYVAELLIELVDSEGVCDFLEDTYAEEEPVVWAELSDAEQDRYTERSSEFEDKVIARAAQALVNLCKGRPDKVAHWATTNHR